MASEQVQSRKKQAKPNIKEEERHPVLYRHQDCIPNPKLLPNCERHAVIGLKNNQSYDSTIKIVTDQGTKEPKHNPKKVNTKNKNNEQLGKVIQDSKSNTPQTTDILGNNEELSKSRKRRLRKRRLLVALAPTLSNNKSSLPVENSQATKPNHCIAAQSSSTVNPTCATNKPADGVKPSTKDSRKRSEKSINSRNKSLKSKSLLETTHQSKADIIKTLEEKTLNSLLQTLVPLTNSSPKKEKPAVRLFSFPEKKLNLSESKVDKDGVFYFGETKHQLERLSSTFNKYNTSPVHENLDTAQGIGLNRNCYSSVRLDNPENFSSGFTFPTSVSDKFHFSPPVRSNFYGVENISPGNQVDSNNIFSVPTSYQSKDLLFNPPVLKDLNQFRSELCNIGGSTFVSPSQPTGVASNPNNLVFGDINSLQSSKPDLVNVLKPADNPQGNCCIAKSVTETLSKEINTIESVKNSPVVMKSAGDVNKVNKSREEVLAEREAKKAAKQAAKLKKSALNSNNKSEVARKESPTLVNKDVSQKIKIASEKKDVTSEISTSSTEKEQEIKLILKNEASLKEVENNIKNELGNQEVCTKSKAELRAERRAKQEAQRAAKTSAKSSQSQVKEKITQVKKVETKPVSLSMGQVEKKVEAIKTIAQPKPKLFSHLYKEKTCLASDKLFKVSSLHPAIVRLGVQYASRVVVGSNARCVALLHALKQMVSDYTTPFEKDFSRGLEEELGPVTAYLNQCRPLAVSMTNALRHIKRTLTQLPNNIPDVEAKRKICDVVDTYIHEQIDVAGKAICNTVKNKIANGDVILIYGCSSLLYQILVESHMSGTKFRVVVVDGLPWLEGKEMLRRLVEKGVSCTYVLITAISFIMREATKVLLGAHALLANGYVMSRAGSSQVALLAHCCNVPVLVCCETHKFCERVQTDAFVYNELGELCCDNIKEKEKGRTMMNLTPLSLAYDITPPDLVSAVVTELAVLPCTSVPVILRIKPSESVM